MIKAELVGRQCFDCYNDGEDGCRLYVARYFEDGGGCRDRCRGYVRVGSGEVLKVVSSVVQYGVTHGGVGREVLEEHRRLRALDSGGWREVYDEELHKNIKPGRGGERSDRTHKLFGKQRMKDNRIKFCDWKIGE